jgi:hypothetical protein
MMYKLLILGLLTLTLSTHAQDKKALDSVDKIIMQTIINPAEEGAASEGPNWVAIGQQVRASYTEAQTDRAVTKAKIYYYYGKDWAQFSTAIVHYTDTYESKDDLPLMNKNAKMILDHSLNPADWKAAQSWAKHAADKNPSNAAYRATYDALTAKINGQ